MFSCYETRYAELDLVTSVRRFVGIGTIIRPGQGGTSHIVRAGISLRVSTRGTEYWYHLLVIKEPRKLIRLSDNIVVISIQLGDKLHQIMKSGIGDGRTQNQTFASGTRVNQAL